MSRNRMNKMAQKAVACFGIIVIVLFCYCLKLTYNRTGKVLSNPTEFVYENFKTLKKYSIKKKYDKLMRWIIKEDYCKASNNLMYYRDDGHIFEVTKKSVEDNIIEKKYKKLFDFTNFVKNKEAIFYMLPFLRNHIIPNTNSAFKTMKMIILIE